MTKHGLFSTPLWHIEGAPLELVDELYQGAYYLKGECSSANKSNKGGYQTPSFDWEDFHPTGKKLLTDVVSYHLKKEFEVTNWWYNINPKGAYNIPHTHSGCDLALVWYVTDSDGLLNLLNPHPQRIIESRTDNNDEQLIGINAKKGDILIFPADIWHFVKPNERDTDRISISMNLQLS